MIYKVTRHLTYFMEAANAEEVLVRANMHRFNPPSIAFPHRPFEYEEGTKYEPWQPDRREGGE